LLWYQSHLQFCHDGSFCTAIIRFLLYFRQLEFLYEFGVGHAPTSGAPYTFIPTSSSRKNECWRLTPSSQLVKFNSIIKLKSVAIIFMAGRWFFPVKRLSSVPRLHLIGPRLQVHVDDVKGAWASATHNARAAGIKIGWILGSSCILIYSWRVLGPERLRGRPGSSLESQHSSENGDGGRWGPHSHRVPKILWHRIWDIETRYVAGSAVTDTYLHTERLLVECTWIPYSLNQTPLSICRRSRI
jgi:hypothetical protein